MKTLVHGFPVISDEDHVYEGWIYEEQKIMSFMNERALRAKPHLALVHADICGPIRTPSLTVSKYFSLDNC